MSSAPPGEVRQIGSLGTWARLIVGSLLLVLGVIGGKVFYMHGHLQLGTSAAALMLGFLGYPAILVALQWLRLRWDRNRLEATGPVETVINIVIFALLIAISFAPSISYIGFAAFIFYGVSMLLAAVRGYAGCEVLAVSNWFLQRDDEVGCLVLSPVDQWERNYQRHSST